jgi:uncharacterized zinc-type alcohol dehydrogenase-like protein
LLDFAAEHRITADVEILPAEQVEIAVKLLRANDMRYRFVLDMNGRAPVPARG